MTSNRRPARGAVQRWLSDASGAISLDAFIAAEALEAEASASEHKTEVPVEARPDAPPQHTGTKHNKAKTRIGLISPIAAYEEGIVMAAGEIKYDTYNWRKGLSWVACLEAAKRHIELALMGEDFDDETGATHFACARSELAFVSEYRYTHPELDDRYKLPKEVIEAVKAAYKTQLTPKVEALQQARRKREAGE